MSQRVPALVLCSAFIAACGAPSPDAVEQTPDEPTSAATSEVFIPHDVTPADIPADIHDDSWARLPTVVRDTLGPEEQRVFLYMPFMHAEDLQLQNRSVTLFTKLGRNEKFANEHRDVIAKFGRFPHRNQTLGRQSRAGEQAAIEDGASW